MALGDGPDNAAFAGLSRKFARRPMADRTPRRLRGLTGQGDDLAPLLCAEGGRSPGAWGVLETLVHGTAGAFEPVATPAPDCGACCAEATGHGRVPSGPPPTGGSRGLGSSGVGASYGHGSACGARGAPPRKVARQEAWGQASSAPLLFRQCGLSVWSHDMPRRSHTKGILFSPGCTRKCAFVRYLGYFDLLQTASN